MGDDEDHARRRRRRRDVAVVILAFLAGTSNAICQRRFDCFASMMTGNAIAASTALSERRWNDALFRSSLVGGYAIGTACARSVESTCRDRQLRRRMGDDGPAAGSEDDAHHLGIVAPIVAAIFAAAEIMGDRRVCGRGGWNVPLLAAGYGMVYSSANRALGPTMTHVVTGHVTKLSESMSDRFLPCGYDDDDGRSLSSEARRRDRDGVHTSARVLSSFVAGVVVGVRLLNLLADDWGFPFFAIIGVVYALVLASI